jgi:hypothetical protein
MKEIMRITAVTDGKEWLEGYEIVFDSPGSKEVEIMVAPDGKILEDSADEQEKRTTPRAERRPAPGGASRGR